MLKRHPNLAPLALVVGIWAVVVVLAVFVLSPTKSENFYHSSPEAPGPWTYEEVQVGVPYRIAVHCTADFEMGGTWWRFEQVNEWPPPMPAGPDDPVVQPHPVPGVITLTSPTTATFRADSNGAEMHLTTTNEHVEAGCI